MVIASKQLTIVCALAVLALSAVQAVSLFNKEAKHDVQPMCRQQGGIQECCVLVMPAFEGHEFSPITHQELLFASKLEGTLIKRSSSGDKKVPVSDQFSKVYPKEKKDPIGPNVTIGRGREAAKERPKVEDTKKSDST